MADDIMFQVYRDGWLRPVTVKVSELERQQNSYLAMSNLIASRVRNAVTTGDNVAGLPKLNWSIE